jgi:hypothetical protein
LHVWLKPRIDNDLRRYKKAFVLKNHVLENVTGAVFAIAILGTEICQNPFRLDVILDASSSSNGNLPSAHCVT